MNRTGLAVTAMTMGAMGTHSGCRTEIVTPVVASIVVVAPAEASILEGDNLWFTAAVIDEFDQAWTQAVVAWSADDSSVVRVDAQGRASGLAAGTTLIWARLGDAAGSARVTVTSTPGCGSEVPATGGKPKKKKDKSEKNKKQDDDGGEDDGDDEQEDDPRCPSAADAGGR